MISDWQALCKSQKIPCSNEFSLTNILGDQVHISTILLLLLSFFSSCLLFLLLACYRCKSGSGKSPACPRIISPWITE